MLKDKNPLFSMFSLNIRSFNKHADELNLYLQTLEHNFDLIGLIEVGSVDNLETHVANLGKYNIYYQAGNNTFIGAAILVKENINVSNVRKDISVKKRDDATIFFNVCLTRSLHTTSSFRSSGLSRLGWAMVWCLVNCPVLDLSSWENPSTVVDATLP